MKILTKIAFVAVFGFTLCFAQEAPEKLAVYVYGASDAGINKSLGNKLLVAMSQSGEYAEIADPDSFQDEFSMSDKGDIAKISQAAKRHGADYVCVVSMNEVLGAYSITARFIKIVGYQVIKTVSTDRAFKSLEDLTAASNELAHQLLPPLVAPPKEEKQSTLLQHEETPVLPQKQCVKTYNVNELLFKLKENFPNQLKDCSSKLAKDMLTPATLGGKKLDPKSFMTQCTMDGIKKKLPYDFPGTDKIIGSLTNFVQGILNSAFAGGGLDPKKLLSVVASINIENFLNDVKKLTADACVVNEPYEPSIASTGEEEYRIITETETELLVAYTRREDYPDNNENNSDEEKNSFSLGFRGGLNSYFVHGNFHISMVFDIPFNDLLHLQPGLMFIRKYYNKNYIELPLLLSLKLGAFRVNTGAYLGLPDMDRGLSEGIGFDIGMFYIGAFYEYGLAYPFRTLGFTLGINF